MWASDNALRRGGLRVWACLVIAVQAATSWEKDYKKWLQNEKGYSFGTVRIVEDDNGKKMLVATQAIKENFLIVKMPTASAFNEETVQLRTTGIGCEAEKLSSVDPRARATLLLLTEYADPDSSWRLMLDKLNWEPDVPVAWAAPDIALLRGSGLLLEVKRDTDMLLKAYTEISEECSKFSNTFSLQEFMKAGGVLAISGAGEESILPYIEVANHEDDPNAEIGAAEDEGVFALVSTRDIREGEEISVSYASDPSDLALVTRYGFMGVAETIFPRKGTLIFPGCIPPSLFEISQEVRQEKGDSFEGFSPELLHCCGDDVEDDDKFCYGRSIRDPVPARSFAFSLGPILPDGTEGTVEAEVNAEGEQRLTVLEDLLHRFRTLVSDSGYIKTCDDVHPEIQSPISMASELYVMHLFKILIVSHLDETSWAAGGGEPPPPADKASQTHIELIRKAMVAERGVFEWYKSAIEFVELHLKLPDAKALQEGLCERAVKKSKWLTKYAWFVENVLAPLAFAPSVEKSGETCGIKQVTYKLTVKECKAVLKAKKKDHGGEL